MNRVLCIGLNPTVDVSCDAERVRPTHKVRTHNQRHHPGGGGVNVARVIAELGGEADLVYLSGGASGALLDDLLAATPVTLRRIGIHAPVRMAFMVHEKETGQEYRFVPEGPEISREELDLAFDAVRESSAGFVVASGSLPRGAPDDTYARMADLVARRGGRFVLDATGPALARALDRDSVFLVKPSLGELEALTGRKLGPEGAGEAALELVKRKAARYVAVTMGRDGALLAGDAGIRRYPAHEVTVRSAVGAGDSFLGAMIFALAGSRPIEDAFAFGLAAGAAAVLTPGTELCRRQDVLAIYETGKRGDPQASRPMG